MKEWDMRFKECDNLDECCTGCAVEILVSGDGSTKCPECGYENVLPCNECSYLNEYMCDWSRITNSCTPFPKEKDR